MYSIYPQTEACANWMAANVNSDFGDSYFFDSQCLFKEVLDALTENGFVYDEDYTTDPEMERV